VFILDHTLGVFILGDTFGMIGNATDGQDLRDGSQTLNLPADTLLYNKSQLY
jgi:hypothetical protein